MMAMEPALASLGMGNKATSVGASVVSQAPLRPTAPQAGVCHARMKVSHPRRLETP
jgi:hypothetical protein